MLPLSFVGTPLPPTLRVAQERSPVSVMPEHVRVVQERVPVSVIPEQLIVEKDPVAPVRVPPTLNPPVVVILPSTVKLDVNEDTTPFAKICHP